MWPYKVNLLIKSPSLCYMAARTKINHNYMIQLQKEERRSPFEVGVNGMPVQPTHDDMATGHVISGARLLSPLGVDTIVTK